MGELLRAVASSSAQGIVAPGPTMRPRRVSGHNPLHDASVQQHVAPNNAERNASHVPNSHAFQGGRPASMLEGRRGARLTPRELEVLELLARGLQNKQICRELDISDGTVKAHVTGILAKLRVASRVQAVIVAMDTDLLRSHEVADKRHG